MKRSIFCFVLVIMCLCSALAYAVQTPPPSPPPSYMHDGTITYNKVCDHQWGPWHYDRYGAVCGEWGLKWRECTKCGALMEDEYIIEHEWGEWKIEYPPKDGKPGMLYRKCKICGKIEYKYYWDDEKVAALNLKMLMVSDPKTAYFEGDVLVFTAILNNSGNMDLKAPAVTQYRSYVDQENTLQKYQLPDTVMPPTDTVLFDDMNNCQFTYTITKEDVLAGMVTLFWQGEALPTEGESKDPVYSDVFAIEFPVIEAKPAISISVMDDYYDGHTYMPGDEYTAWITTTNTGNVPLVDIWNTRGYCDENKYDYDISYPNPHVLQPGESFTAIVGVVASDLDLIANVIERHWYAYGYWNDIEVQDKTATYHPIGTTDPDKICNPFLVVNDYGAESQIHGVDEIIYADWTITNIGKANCTLTMVMQTTDSNFQNDIAGGQAGAFLAAQGGSASNNFMLYLSNDKVKDNEVVVYYQGHVVDENGIEIFTNIVKKTYKIDPWAWNVPATVSIHKEVISKPTHDLAYVEGDYVAYSIWVVNNGDTEITNVQVYDPLFDNSAPLDAPITLPAHYSHEYTFLYLVTEMDKNYISNQAIVTWNDPALPDTQSMPSNVVIVAITEEKDIRFIKSVMSSTPVYPNGSFYAKGDVIEYTLRIENDSDAIITSALIFDGLENSSDYFVTETVNIPSGGYREIIYTHTVTQKDVDDGSVTNIAWMKYRSEMGISGVVFSNPVTVPTGTPKTAKELVITKSLDSAPPQHGDDSYYTTDDVITFMIFVDNPTDYTYTNIEVSDALLPGEVLEIIPVLGPGESKTIEFKYTVTPADVWQTYVLNGASITYKDEDDYWRTIFSNKVKVNIGNPDDKLVIVKSEISTRVKGYYEAYDYIQYSIRIKNIGNTVLNNIEISDILSDINPIAVIPSLAPEEIYECYFTYQVKEDPDVKFGAVINRAQARYTIYLPDNFTLQPTYDSNTVISPTGPKPKGSGISCVRELMSADAGSQNYRVTYCPEHLATAQQVEQKLAAAVTREEQLAAYAEIRELWLTEILEQYDLGAANPLFATERDAFLNLIDTMEAYLRAIGMDEVKVQSQIVYFLSSRCTDLCYERGNAGQPRKDAYSARRTIGAGSASDDCSLTISAIVNGAQDIGLRFCAEHSEIRASILDQLIKAPSEDAFEYARALWLGQLNTAFTARYTAAEPAARTAIIAYRTAIGNWLSARAALLTSAEPLSQLLEYFVVLNCE